jgi:hypothetical protein
LNHFLVGDVGRHDTVAQPSMTHLTGLMSWLGLVTRPSGGHGTACNLTMLGYDPFKKARPVKQPPDGCTSDL